MERFRAGTFCGPPRMLLLKVPVEVLVQLVLGVVLMFPVTLVPVTVPTSNWEQFEYGIVSTMIVPGYGLLVLGCVPPQPLWQVSVCGVCWFADPGYQ